MSRADTLPELFCHGSQYEIEGSYIRPGIRSPNYPQSSTSCVYMFSYPEGEDSAWSWAANEIDISVGGLRVAPRERVYILKADATEKDGNYYEWIAPEAEVVDRIDIRPSVAIKKSGSLYDHFSIIQGTLPGVNWNIYLDPPLEYQRKYGFRVRNSIDTNHMPYQFLYKKIGEAFSTQNLYAHVIVSGESAINDVKEFEQLSLF